MIFALKWWSNGHFWWSFEGIPHEQTHLVGCIPMTYLWKLKDGLIREIFSARSPFAHQTSRTHRGTPGFSPTEMWKIYGFPHFFGLFIELDDGKIWENLQESPINLMVKTHGFPVKIFPTKPIHWVVHIFFGLRFEEGESSDDSIKWFQQWTRPLMDDYEVRGALALKNTSRVQRAARHPWWLLISLGGIL